MRRASPYRTQPPSIALEPCKTPVARARFTTSRGAWAASFAAHAAVLGALSLASTPQRAWVYTDPGEPTGAGQGIYIHAESRPAFPLPQWVQACFGRANLPAPHDCMHGDYDLPMSEAFGYLAGTDAGWARIETSTFPDYHLDSIAQSVGSAARDCANYASQAGWSGVGRVFVRVDHREDGEAIATTTPLGDDARHDALLCCLRQAQAPLIALLRPGGAVRFVLVFGADPAQRYIGIEHTTSSRRGGGPEALAALQTAFTD